MDYRDDPCYPLLNEAFQACHARLDQAVPASTDPATSPWLALQDYQGAMLGVIAVSLFVGAVAVCLLVRQNRRSSR